MSFLALHPKIGPAVYSSVLDPTVMFQGQACKKRPPTSIRPFAGVNRGNPP